MAIKPTKREIRSRQTRTKIVDAAERLFYQYGINTVSVKDIAAEAGLTTGALYHHFENKDDLIMAVFSRHDLDFGRLIGKYEVSDDPLGDIVNFLSVIMVKRIDDDGMEFTRQRVLHYFHSDKPTGFDTCLRTIIRRGLELGSFRPGLTEEELFDLLASVHRGAAYEYCVRISPFNLREITGRRLLMTLEGVAASG